MDTDGLFAIAPPTQELSDEVIDPAEKRVVKFAEKLLGEGQAWQEDLNLEQQIILSLDMLASKHFIDVKERRYRARVTANFFRHIVERKVGTLTAASPEFKVISRSGNTAGAEVAQDVMHAVWDEYDGVQFTDAVVLQSLVAGCAPTLAVWDPSLDFGYGDVRMDVLMPDQCILDPHFRNASRFQRDCNYAIVKVVRPIAEFRQFYGARGHMVKPQPDFSQYTKMSGQQHGGSPGVWRRPSRRGTQNFENSAIPRAMEYRCYFRDMTVNPIEPKKKDGSPNFLFPRKRLIVWSWDGVLLYDGDGINWDGRYPLEILDWGMTLEHPYGETEITHVHALQMALNVLLSGTVHNARLHNEPPWVAEEGSIDPDEIEEWERFGDKPMKVFFYNRGFNRPQKEVPQALPQVVFETISMVRQAMEIVGGVPPVSQGRKDGGVTAASAIEALQDSARVPIDRSGRRVDSWMGRYGQLLLSRIIQFFPDERVLYLTENARVQEVLAQRQEFIQGLVETETEEEMEARLQSVVRDFRFKVVPGSSLAINDVQKAAFAERQAAAGRMSDVEVLQAARIPEAERKVEEARQDQQKKAMMMAQIRALLSAGQPQPGGARQRGTEPPQTPGVPTSPREITQKRMGAIQ